MTAAEILNANPPPKEFYAYIKRHPTDNGLAKPHLNTPTPQLVTSTGEVIGRVSISRHRCGWGRTYHVRAWLPNNFCQQSYYGWTCAMCPNMVHLKQYKPVNRERNTYPRPSG